MTMKHKVIFADLGWYEVNAKSKADVVNLLETGA